LNNEHLYDEQELLVQVAKGDEHAFSVLFHRYMQKVYNVAWIYTRDAGLAEDIVQDSFALLWKNRQKMPEIKDVGRYLYVIGRNRAVRVLQNLESIKRSANTFSSVQVQHSDDVSRRIPEKELEALVHQGLEFLSPQQRQVFELSRLQGLSRDEVAEQMQISKATVGVHLTLAIKKMRVFLINRLGVPAVLWLLKTFL
jgi:RNA polymerase sigma-70 factor (ECF subfamily)